MRKTDHITPTLASLHCEILNLFQSSHLCL